MSLRALDDDQVLDRYLDVKAEIDRLTRELDGLKPVLTAALWDEPDHRTVHRGYEIALGFRKTYEYSEDVKVMERGVKKAKEYERHAGLAALTTERSFPIVKPVRAQRRQAA